MKIAIVLTIFVGILVGCKKTPTNSQEIPAPEAEGTFLGWGRPGGTWFNVKLDIDGTDSTGWSGTIAYGNSMSTLTVTEVSPDQDTIRFEYIRATTYRLLGIISGVAVTLFVLEPSGQPAYVLNKVQGNYNMSGDWNGLIYSQYLNSTEDAELFMDQQGVLFNGDVQANFGFYSLLGDITNGGQEGSAFYLAGTAPFGNGNYPFQFEGIYVTPDSILGTWILDVTGGGDSGTFAFGRRF